MCTATRYRDRSFLITASILSGSSFSPCPASLRQLRLAATQRPGQSRSDGAVCERSFTARREQRRGRSERGDPFRPGQDGRPSVQRRHQHESDHGRGFQPDPREVCARHAGPARTGRSSQRHPSAADQRRLPCSRPRPLMSSCWRCNHTRPSAPRLTASSQRAMSTTGARCRSQAPLGQRSDRGQRRRRRRGRRPCATGDARRYQGSLTKGSN